MPEVKYDYVIIGSGFFGSICARELTDKGYKCLVIEKRKHIGGNCYTEKVENINVHKYGAHIFHTSNKEVWEYVNRFVEFNSYRHHVVANYKNEMYSLPFNMFTFNKLWNINTPKEAKDIIEQQRFKGDPTNLEEQALSLVGEDVYKKLIKGYTEKQWMKSCKELPSFIIKRLPVRFIYDNNYFFDPYQGIPKNGYTELFEKLLEGIEIKLDTDYFNDREHFDSLAKTIIYTGPIDKYYNYCFGELEYRPLKFEHTILNQENYQGHSVINYTEKEVPYTRIIEHKHFNNDTSDKTIITKEYPIEWSKDEEPYYPINDIENNKKYLQYKDLIKQESNTIFGGRLAEYKYYDMHQVIESALKFVKQLNN
jgi:UDP-galactopyranose mutase